ncbi:MAG TPA: hypothetical protein VFN56_02300 [Candidatus Saccharimonadales bacterium]|nr:hypothetical protein [Candidatus Saccharimonadales bacterium]
MTLFAIVTQDQVGKHGCDVSLERACQARGITYSRLVVENIVLDDVRSMSVPPNSLLYRVSLDSKAVAIESLLATMYTKSLTTMYDKQVFPHPHKRLRELSRQIAEELPIIPTILLDTSWLRMADDDITQRIATVGGFPVIVKTLGLSHGQGVVLTHSVPEFRQYLASVDLAACNTIARKYLAEYRHYRLIVVAGEVIAAIEYHKPNDDFRTNAAPEPTVTAVDIASLPAHIIDLARTSVKLRASILGGVDVLVEQPSETAYLAEVNVPCYFARAEQPTGIDIAGHIVDALIDKQRQHDEQ